MTTARTLICTLLQSDFVEDRSEENCNDSSEKKKKEKTHNHFPKEMFLWGFGLTVFVLAVGIIWLLLRTLRRRPEKKRPPPPSRRFVFRLFLVLCSWLPSFFVV